MSSALKPQISEASVLIELPINFARKFEVQPPEMVMNVNSVKMSDENRFSRFFFFFVSLHDEIDTSVSLASLIFSRFLCATSHVLSHTSALTLWYAAPSFEKLVILPNIVSFELRRASSPLSFKYHPQCVFVSFFQSVQTLPKLTCHLT